MKKLYYIACLLLVCVAMPSGAQDINELIRKEVSGSAAEAGLMYRELHQNPELSLQEFRTAAMMAEELDKLVFKVTTGVKAMSRTIIDLLAGQKQKTDSR